MKEQHPIDDLFARMLRDTEEVPPAEVWHGVVRSRSGAHMLLLRLRRKWGWLALLLLLFGTGGYLAGTSMRTPGSQAGTPATPSAALPEPPLIVAGTAADRQRDGASDSLHPASVPVHTGHNTASEVDAQTVPQANMLSMPSPPANRHVDVATAGTAATGPLAHEPAAAPILHKTPVRADGSTALPILSHSAPSREVKVDTDRSDGDPALAPAGEVVLAASIGRSGLERIRPIGIEPFPLDPALATPAPHHLPPAMRQPVPWIALTAGSYRETRTWHGGPASLAEALRSTETPHYTIGLGVLAGLEWRGGWNLAMGLEYNASRYQFHHRDHIRTRIDSLVTHVVTFNSMVVGSYVDTLPAIRETEETVASVNRYTSLRIPVEAGWHRAWWRWHYGLRAGVSADFNTMRSGFTLVNGPEGARTVDVAGVEKRNSVQVGGNVALDIGYALHERLALWASPGYGTSLLSLSSTDTAPQATSARWGIRFRLAYTFHH